MSCRFVNHHHLLKRRLLRDPPKGANGATFTESGGVPLLCSVQPQADSAAAASSSLNQSKIDLSKRDHAFAPYGGRGVGCLKGSGCLVRSARSLHGTVSFTFSRVLSVASACRLAFLTFLGSHAQVGSGRTGARHAILAVDSALHARHIARSAPLATPCLCLSLPQVVAEMRDTMSCARGCGEASRFPMPQKARS